MTSKPPKNKSKLMLLVYLIDYLKLCNSLFSKPKKYYCSLPSKFSLRNLTSHKIQPFPRLNGKKIENVRIAEVLRMRKKWNGEIANGGFKNKMQQPEMHYKHYEIQPIRIVFVMLKINKKLCVLVHRPKCHPLGSQ